MPQTHAQFVLFDGFDPLDVVAPFEVFSAGRDALGGGLDVELVSAKGPHTVASGTSGLSLTATGQLDPSAPGYVVIPGASGLVDGDPDAGDDTIPVWLSRFAAAGAAPLLARAIEEPDVTVATVCGGSLAVAMASLLEGRTATTHVLGIDISRPPVLLRCGHAWSTMAIAVPRVLSPRDLTWGSISSNATSGHGSLTP